jgi:phosphoesterase RecJ-like protein
MNEKNTTTQLTVPQTAEFLRNNNYFTLLCHAGPDGDTLGSGYALCGVLHLIGKHARVLCSDTIPPRFRFLLDAVKPALTEFDDVESPETIITVDIADTVLLGSLKDKYTEFDLCIDHHISNKCYAKQTLLDDKAAACAELVWRLIKELIPEKKLRTSSRVDKIAAAIYTGVSTDTGCFRYPNTTINSHLIAAELMTYGFDIAPINYYMFEMKTKARIALEQLAFADMEYHFGGRCAIAVLTQEMLEGIDTEDTDNVSLLPKQIEGVEIGAVVKSKCNVDSNGLEIWKISVRTSGNVSAQEICSELGGGGHMRAAGCTLSASLADVKALLLKAIKNNI